jgi:hypothetical protein
MRRREEEKVMKTEELKPEGARAERLKYGSMPGLHSHNSARNAMSGLMPPSVSTRKASGAVMSAIRPRHPLCARYATICKPRRRKSAREETGLLIVLTFLYGIYSYLQDLLKYN